MEKKSLLTASKLSLMMFLQYLFFAIWWVPLAAYLTNIGIEGIYKSLILSSMAFGCIISPIVGSIADRYFSAEKLLASLNIITSLMLFLASRTESPVVLFWLLLVGMLCYMPSWSLVSSISMRHLSADVFPTIRVFGSIGWVVSALFSVVYIALFGGEFDGTSLPMFFAAIVGVVAAVTNLFLPKTPPTKADKIKVIDVLGLRTLTYMKDRNFAVFIACSFIIMVPFAAYWSYVSQFLSESGYRYITLTMNWGQVAEILFMLGITLFITKFGIRNTLLAGLFFLFVRYGAFYFGVKYSLEWLYLVGILMQGLIFGGFFVGGQIYINNYMPIEMKVQAQGFIFLVTFGVGLLFGNFIIGNVIESCTVDGVIDWQWIWGFATLSTVVIMGAFILLFKPTTKVS